MHALRQEILPPSGVEFATSLRLTPSTLEELPTPPNATTRHEFAARALCNVVIARSSILRIFEVREEPVVPQVDDERERKKALKGTEAVEGEVAMDEQGEGFVNIAKSSGQTADVAVRTTTKFYLVREHRLHGIVTGIEGVKIITTLEDKLDRLLVSFRDAKIALLEWSFAVHDLITVSIHTYERAPQLMTSDPSLFRAELRVDPHSRCSALSLPKDAFAILPFYQTQAELDVMDQDQTHTRDVPYAPSFILDLPAAVDQNIRNIVDFVFLPGFNKPTIAVLFQTQQTWTGRLKEFKDTARLVIFTLDIVTQTYPIITSVQGLPYDCFAIMACPASLGGVVILSCNSIIYVDQSYRLVILPLNGWQARISDFPLPSSTPEQRDCNIHLEGCHATFVDDRTLFLILKDGTVYPVDIVVEGKVVTKMTMSSALAQTTIPSVIRRITDTHVFIGSTVGPSVLLNAAQVEEDVDEDEEMSSPTAFVQMHIDYDDDDGNQFSYPHDVVDIYGDSEAKEPATNGHVNGKVAKKTRTVIRLSECDSLPAYGPIADMTFSLARNGERHVPELVAATGSGHLGGFTVFQRDLPIRTKRKLHAIGGARGMWSLPIRQTVKTGGISYEHAMDPYHAENDTLILSTDINPSPGLSRIATRAAKGDVSIATRIQGTTIGAAPFFQRTAILHVVTNAIRVLEPDGTERQIIKDMDGNMPRPKIRACSISDPFVLIVREDDSIGLFIGETERGKIRRKDMSPMGDKVRLFEKNLKSSLALDGATTTLQAAVNPGSSGQSLLLVRPQGILEVFLRSGQLTIYEAHAGGQGSDPPPTVRVSSLDIKFVKVLSKAFEIQRPEEGEKSILAEQKRVLRMLVPFVTAPAPGTTYSGVFFTGDRPSWILSTDKCGLQLYPSGHNVVHAFTPCSLWDSKGDFLLYSEEVRVSMNLKCVTLIRGRQGPSLLEWIPEFDLNGPLPSRNISRGRSYSNLIFDASTHLIVAASSLQARFASFDEDGNKVWEPETSNISDPLCDCSTLELVSPDLWVTMDGYEFATNEFINDMTVVSLETAGTETGTKEFIAVGTSINRGEDLAVKGAVSLFPLPTYHDSCQSDTGSMPQTYIFEIAEVVPDPAFSSKRWYKLRLRCRDDAKGPVTAVCGFSGYLVSSMGQKVSCDRWLI
ncbi:hypothetical protein C0989_004941 [Termitomyces sp. Mn162]|nr:hypothetical protein C0989_004941 [Termitomyces sp. Mn162]